jgi:hypothetical protein
MWVQGLTAVKNVQDLDAAFTYTALNHRNVRKTAYVNLIEGAEPIDNLTARKIQVHKHFVNLILCQVFYHDLQHFL